MIPLSLAENLRKPLPLDILARLARKMELRCVQSNY